MGPASDRTPFFGPRVMRVLVVVRWLRKKYPRLTWKQIKRRYWQRTWSGVNGARLAWPAAEELGGFFPGGYSSATVDEEAVKRVAEAVTPRQRELLQRGD